MTCLCWPGRETDESSDFSQISIDEPRPLSPALSLIPFRRESLHLRVLLIIPPRRMLAHRSLIQL